MLDRSRVLLFGALLTAVSLVPADRCGADMVLTIDGKWTPLAADAAVPGPDELPTDEALAASDEFIVDATYETVKSNKNFSRPAGQVLNILASDSLKGSFKKALNDASSGFFAEAAEQLMSAAEGLKAFGKQSALKGRIDCYVQGGLVPQALAACDDLMSNFPKSFYFCDVQILRAKVAATKNAAESVDEVTKILAAVTTAPGMNNRDIFRAEWTRIFLTLELPRKFEAAEKAYRDLVTKIDKTDAVQGETMRQRAQVGVGNCLVATKKETEARGFFEKATESRNPDVLAGAYLGLGNVALSEAKALRDAGSKPEAKDKLTEAVAHYLRVTVKYKSEVEDSSPVLDALVNQARVFVALFEMSGNKDCETADRAARAFRELVEMPSIGSARNGFIREFRTFDEKKKAACSPPPPPPPADKPK